MFHNYQELLYDYVEFYKASLFDDPRQSKQDEAIEKAEVSMHRPKLIRNTRDLSCKIAPISYSYHFAEAATTANLSDTHQSTELYPSRSIRQNDLGAACQVDKGEPVIGAFNGLTSTDLLYMVTVFINLILLKRYLSRWIKSSNLVKSLGLREKDQERLDESIWRLIYYTFSSSWLIYSCFLKHQAKRLFDKDAKITEYLSGVDLDEYLICMIEAGFYLHATYAIVVEDIWRRDSPMMLLHHIAAIFSVLAIYATRTHRIGLAAVVLRDTCDVLLEITKVFLCLRIQHGRIIKSMDRSVKYMLVVFTGAFVINQLYFYPLFCLYHAFNLIKQHKLRTPSMTGILTCGLIFLVLDLVWFGLILRLLYRMLFTNEPLKDLREYDDESSNELENKAGQLKQVNLIPDKKRRRRRKKRI